MAAPQKASRASPTQVSPPARITVRPNDRIRTDGRFVLLALTRALARQAAREEWANAMDNASKDVEP